MPIDNQPLLEDTAGSSSPTENVSDISSKTLEQARSDVIKWYRDLSAENLSVKFPFNQLFNGYLYPFALPALSKADSLKLRHFIGLVNRLTILRQPQNDKQSFNFSENSKHDLYGYIQFFENYQDECYDFLNREAYTSLKKIVKAICANRSVTNDSSWEKALREFAVEVVRYTPKLEHGNVRDDYGCLKQFILALRQQDKFKNLQLTQLEINQLIKLRDDLVKKRNELDLNLKRIKRDINRYLVSEQHDTLIGNITKLPRMSDYDVQTLDSDEESSDSDKSSFNSNEVFLQSEMDSSVSDEEDTPRIFAPIYARQKIAKEARAKKLEQYAAKHTNRWIAGVSSGAVGFGEGAVPFATVAAQLQPHGSAVALPIGLLCGISGGFYNKFLVEGDTFTVLNKLIYKRSLNAMPNPAEDFKVEFYDDKNKFQDIEVTPHTLHLFINKENESIDYKVKRGDKVFGKTCTDGCYVYFPEIRQMLNLPKEQKFEAWATKFLLSESRYDPAAYQTFIVQLLERVAARGHINGLEVKQLKKDAAIVLGTAALTTAFVYAALSALKLYSGVLMPLLTTLKLGNASSILSISAAFPPVFLTALGFFSIYFFVISDLIARERWIDIKNYFLKKFVDVGWGELHGKQFFYQLLDCVFEVLKLLLVVALASFVSFISYTLFHQSVEEAVSSLTSAVSSSMSVDNAALIATIITAISTLVLYIFNVKKVGDIGFALRLREILIGLLLIVPRLFLLSVAAVNVTLKLAVTLVAALPFLFLNGAKWLHDLILVSLPSLLLVFGDTLVKLMSSVLTLKLPLKLMAATLSTALVLVGAVMAFSLKSVTFALFTAIYLAAFMLTLGQADLRPLRCFYASFSKLLEKPAMACFMLAGWLKTCVDNWSAWIDNSVYGKPIAAATKHVGQAVMDAKNTCINHQNRVSRSALFQSAQTTTSGWWVKTFDHFNQVSPVAAIACGVDAGLRGAERRLRGTNLGVEPCDNKPQTPTIPDQLDGFKVGFCQTTRPALAFNSIGQAIMFALIQPTLWLQVLTLVCSYTISTLPTEAATAAEADEKLATGWVSPKPA